MRLQVILLLALCAPAIPVMSQAGEQVQEVRVSSRRYAASSPAGNGPFVPVAVAVRDSHGQAVAGLKSADFEVTDQGKDVAIAAATPITAAGPRHIALCFDDYGSSQGQLLRAKSIAVRF